ncbi:MAG: UDP-4-amino-4,6-dideoxy-N-acetyl-beta-L-altrosamine transaminase [Rhodospirillales bacterium]|nr:UDP-4-amino-4,6-dideoxy-N-acetyl-beta-L-altrosamine transaminase [Rhodospirillales bacterium]
MTDKPILPYGRQHIDADDVAAVTAVLNGDFLTTGPAVDEFETAFAEATAAGYAVSCSSATAGLHLAMMALGIGPGDKVAVPSMTFLATANAVRYVGADVVFTDVDPENGLMRPEDLTAVLEGPQGRAIKVVIPVHLAGQTVPMEQISKIADRYGLSVVEDASHAVGTTYDDGAQTKVGSCRHSHMAVFSFHPVKTLAMGEGGGVTTNDPALADRLKSLRNHGMIRDGEKMANTALAFDDDGAVNPWYYEMPEIGYNYRASDLHCALGLSQLHKLDQFISRRRHLVGLYDKMLPKLTPHVRPVARVGRCHPGWHIYPVLIDFDALGKSRAQIMNGLREMGIGTQVHYIPVHRQPYYRALYGNTDLPGADLYYARTLTLPLFPAMKDEDVDRVVGALVDVAGHSNF